MAKKVTFAPLGTSNWRSYARFRAGVRWHEQEKWDDARRLYQEALELDPKNRGARLNLARLETRDGHYTVALEQYQQVIREAAAAEIERGDDWPGRAWHAWLTSEHGATRPASSAYHRDNVWYQAMYQLAAVTYYRAAQLQVKSDELDKLRRRRPRQHVEEQLMATIRRLLPNDATVAVPAGDKELIKRARDAATKLTGESVEYGDTLVTAIESTRRALEATPEYKRWDRQSSIKEKKPAAEENRQLWLYLVSFEPVVRGMYAGCLEANGNSPGGRDQVEMKITGEAKAHYRVQYNLACYHSTRGLMADRDPEVRQAAYQEALRWLEQSLTIAPLPIGQWAQTDLSLRGVRDDAATKVKFKRIIAQSSSRPSSSTAPPPTDVTAVVTTYAQRLRRWARRGRTTTPGMPAR